MDLAVRENDGSGLEMEIESDTERETNPRRGDQEEGELTDSDSERDARRRKFGPDSNGADPAERSFFNNDDLAAMEERAGRFGLDVESDSTTLDDELKRLYRTLDIVNEDDARHARFDTIHVHGTEKMNTNDIFQYFYTHRPLFLEWIDENSCNVVWKDNISAARAMIFYSKAIKCDKLEDMQCEADDAFTSNIWDDAISPSSIPVPVPNGTWRAGAPHPKSEFIFLRFANKSDNKINEDEKLKIISKKYEISEDAEPETCRISESMKSKIRSAKELPEKNKNPWGDLCKTWGINDSQEIFSDRNSAAQTFPPNADPNRKSVKERIGVVSVHQRLNIVPEKTDSGGAIRRLGKRNAARRDASAESENEESESDEDWRSKSKAPRMRMHADDEEEKMAKIKNTITVQIKNETRSDEDSAGSDADAAEKDDRLHDGKKAEAKSNVYTRLGKRFESDEDDDEEIENSKTKSVAVGNMRSEAVKNTSTVWSRLDFSKNKNRSDSDEDSEHENGSDLRHAIRRNKSNTAEKLDLREKIRKKNVQRIPLRIEVTNELYSDRM